MRKRHVIKSTLATILSMAMVLGTLSPVFAAPVKDEGTNVIEDDLQNSDPADYLDFEELTESQNIDMAGEEDVVYESDVVTQENRHGDYNDQTEELSEELSEELPEENSEETIKASVSSDSLEEDINGDFADKVYLAADPNSASVVGHWLEDGDVLQTSSGQNKVAQYKDGVLTLYRGFWGNNQMYCFDHTTIDGVEYYNESMIYADGDLIIEVDGGTTSSPYLFSAVNNKSVGLDGDKNYARSFNGIYVNGDLTIRNVKGKNACLSVKKLQDNLIKNNGSFSIGIYNTGNLKLETQGSNTLSIMCDLYSNYDSTYSYGIFSNKKIDIGSGVTVTASGEDYSHSDVAQISCGICSLDDCTLRTGSTVNVTGGGFNTGSETNQKSVGLWINNHEKDLIIEDNAKINAKCGEVNNKSNSFSNNVRVHSKNATCTLSIEPSHGLYYSGGSWFPLTDLDETDELTEYINTVATDSTVDFSLGEEVELSVLAGEDFYNVPDGISDKYRLMAISDEYYPSYADRSPLDLSTKIYMNTDKTYNLCFIKKENIANPVTEIELLAENLPESLKTSDTVPVKNKNDQDFKITSYSPNVESAEFNYMMSGITTDSDLKAGSYENNSAYYALYLITLADGMSYASGNPPKVTLNDEELTVITTYSYNDRARLYALKKYTIGTPQKCRLNISLNGKGTMPDGVETSYEFEKGQRPVDFMPIDAIKALANLPNYKDASGKEYLPHWLCKDDEEDKRIYSFEYNFGSNALFEDTSVWVEWILKQAVSGKYSFEFPLPAAGMAYGRAPEDNPEAYVYNIYHGMFKDNDNGRIALYPEDILKDKELTEENLINWGTLFEEGKTYYYFCPIEPYYDDGYYLDPASLPDIYINGEKQEVLRREMGVKGKIALSVEPEYVSTEEVYYVLYKFTPGKAKINITLNCNYPNGKVGSYVLSDVPAGFSDYGSYYHFGPSLPFTEALLRIGSMTYDQYQIYKKQFNEDSEAFYKKYPSYLPDKCEGYSPAKWGDGSILVNSVPYLPLTIEEMDDAHREVLESDYFEDSTLYVMWAKDIEFVSLSVAPIPCCGDATANGGEAEINEEHIPETWLFNNDTRVSPGFVTGYYYTSIETPNKALNDGKDYDFTAGEDYLLHLLVAIDRHTEAYENYLWEEALGDSTKLLYNGKEYTGTMKESVYKGSYMEYQIPVKVGHRCENPDGIKRENVVVPTCEEDGSYDLINNFTCAECGQKVESTEHVIISRLGHDWGPWTVEKAATYEESGLAQRLCLNDPKHIETKEIPSLGKGASVTGVTLSPDTLTLKIGESATLEAVVLPNYADDKTVTWSSDDTAVASVDDTGMVTGKKPGSAKITVTTNDGGHTASCAVTVSSESMGDDKDTTRISVEDLENFVFPDKVSKTVFSAPVKVSGNEVKGAVTIEYNNAVSFTGVAIKPDTGSVSANVILDKFIEAANITGKNTNGLFKISYKAKNNKKTGKDTALFYPVLKADSKALKALNLSKEHKKEFKALLKAMNAALKADPCKFSINKASLAELKNGMEFVPAFDKSGAPMMDKKTNMPKIKSIKVKLDSKSTKMKKLSNKAYVIEAYDKEAGTVRIKGAGDFTGTITMKLSK